MIRRAVTRLFDMTKRKDPVDLTKIIDETFGQVKALSSTNKLQDLEDAMTILVKFDSLHGYVPVVGKVRGIIGNQIRNHPDYIPHKAPEGFKMSTSLTP